MDSHMAIFRRAGMTAFGAAPPAPPVWFPVPPKGYGSGTVGPAVFTAVSSGGRVLSPARGGGLRGMGFTPDTVYDPDDPSTWEVYDPYDPEQRPPQQPQVPGFKAQLPALILGGLKVVDDIFAPPATRIAQAGSQYQQQYSPAQLALLQQQRTPTGGIGIGIDGQGIRLSDGSHIGWFPIVAVIGVFFLLQSPGFTRRK
jgi:hypothetical protein